MISAALAVFSQPLSLRFIAMGVVGGLLVASAGALLPQVDVGEHARSVVGIRDPPPGGHGMGGRPRPARDRRRDC